MTDERSDTPEPNRTLARVGIPRTNAANCIRAINAPQRRQILRALHKAGEARSPNELSRAGGTSLGHVYYHVKVLTECGAIALTDTQPRRGAVEHFYASTVNDDKLVGKLLEDTRVEDEGR
jgi:DNA-binding transcriptional ArsR family regulator